ncbi:Hypothetical predicted protein, partial [Pelobates cultripes]
MQQALQAVEGLKQGCQVMEVTSMLTFAGALVTVPAGEEAYDRLIFCTCAMGATSPPPPSTLRVYRSGLLYGKRAATPTGAPLGEAVR